MAITIRNTCFAEITTPSGVIQLGKSSPTSVTAAGGECEEHVVSVANGTSAAIWSTEESGIGDFDYLFMISDQTVKVELSAEVSSFGHTSSRFVVELLANVPLVLSSDFTYTGDATIDFGNTAASGIETVINRLHVYNASGFTASVRFFLAT